MRLRLNNYDPDPESALLAGVELLLAAALAGLAVGSFAGGAAAVGDAGVERGLAARRRGGAGAEELLVDEVADDGDRHQDDERAERAAALSDQILSARWIPG